MTCRGALALIYTRMGAIDRGIAIADLMISELQKVPPTMGLGLAYACIAEAYVARLERALASRPAEVAAARRAVSQTLRRFWMVTRINTLCSVLYYRLAGRLRWIEGARTRAKRAWEHGLATAMKLDLPLGEALLRIDLARCEPPRSEARTRQLVRAEALLSDMQSTMALSDVEALRTER
jgi:hypothetical protein